MKKLIAFLESVKSTRSFLSVYVNRWTKHFAILTYLSLLLLVYAGCKKDSTVEIADQTEASLIVKLKAAGFDVSNGLHKHKNGYLVEGDIFFTAADINNLDEDSEVRIASSWVDPDLSGGSKVNGKISHYRTNNLLTLSYPQRTIQIYMPSTFGTYMQNSLDSAIARYNALDLSLIFTRTTNPSNANITISTTYINPSTNPNDAYLMSAGFPTSGNPYSQINVNTYYFNSSYDRYDATSSLVHEIGHTIGLRHTDYMNRAYSCGGSSSNEGGAGVGANHIPGTPSGGEASSVMLACSNGYDRTFTEGDIVALKETYWYRKDIYVKVIQTVVSDESYYTTYNDYVKIEYDISMEFYQNAGLTIPYTTANYFLLTISNDNEYTGHWTRLLVPNGLTSYNLGTYIQDKEWNYGNLVRDNTTGYRPVEGVGYYLQY